MALRAGADDATAREPLQFKGPVVMDHRTALMPIFYVLAIW